jgi:hypothetical protein
MQNHASLSCSRAAWHPSSRPTLGYVTKDMQYSSPLMNQELLGNVITVDRDSLSKIVFLLGVTSTIIQTSCSRSGCSMR